MKGRAFVNLSFIELLLKNETHFSKYFKVITLTISDQCCGPKCIIFGPGFRNLPQFRSGSEPFHMAKSSVGAKKAVKISVFKPFYVFFCKLESVQT